jgi:anaerobic magnesium-protoporphyrin IX monomethyl ester cyclase
MNSKTPLEKIYQNHADNGLPKAKVMLVYANDRMDNLVSIAPSLLSAYVKSQGHDVKLYDTTFIDEGGLQVGDEGRIATNQISKARLSDQGLTRKIMSNEELQEDFRSTILDYQPDLISFSALEITYEQTARLIESVKDLKIPILVGGLYPTFAPKEVLDNPYVDMICEGEGEYALAELVNKIASVARSEGGLEKIFEIETSNEVIRKFFPTKDIIETLNIAMRVGGTEKPQFYRGGLKAKIDDFGTGDWMESKKVGLQRPDIHMDDLLNPDYAVYEDKRFTKPMGGDFFRAITIETARGCPYGCSFCCIPQQQAHHLAASELREKVRSGSYDFDAQKLLMKVDGSEVAHHKQKSPEKIVKELKDAVDNFKVNYVYFSDETFLAKSKDWMEQFFKEYETIKLDPGSLPNSFVEANPRFVREDNTERLPFFISTRVETVAMGAKRDYAKQLEKIGCGNVALGIESGNAKYRAEYLKRMMSDDTIVQGFKAFGETEIRVSANNIIGLPFETRKDIMNTIRINVAADPDSIIINAFRPYTGTPMRQLCVEKGLIGQGTIAGDNRDLDQFDNGILTAKEIEGLRRTFVLYTTFPESRWDEIKIAEQDDKTFERLSEEFHSNQWLNRKKRINPWDRSPKNMQKLVEQGVQITNPKNITEFA